MKMIWSFVAASLLMVAIGALMLLSPQKVFFPHARR